MAIRERVNKRDRKYICEKLHPIIVYVYRVFGNLHDNIRKIERIRVNGKALYRFAIFAIVIKKLYN